MLTCPKCGYDNELGRIFCHQCGQKLDLNQIQPPRKAQRGHRSRWSVGRIVRLAVRLVILGALACGIYLAAQVPVVPELATTNADLVSFYRKRDAVENAVQRKRSAVITFSESELNAYLQSLKLEQPTGRGIAITVSKLRVSMGAQGATATILGKIGFGERWEKKLALSYTVQPRLADGRLTFQPVAGRIGALPVPRLILQHTPFMDRWFGQVFGQLEDDVRLLNAAAAIETDTQAVRVKIQPAPAS